MVFYKDKKIGWEYEEVSFVIIFCEFFKKFLWIIEVCLMFGGLEFLSWGWWINEDVDCWFILGYSLFLI